MPLPIPFPPLYDPNKPGNGFLPVVPGEVFQTISPVWGMNQNTRATDVLTRSYSNSEESRVYAITPDDTAVLTNRVSQLYVGTSGDVHLLTENGDEVTMANLAEGVNYPFTFDIVKIFATGTTASGIIGTY